MTPSAPSLLTRVRDQLHELPPTERRLAEVVLEFPGELASYSASELAVLANVSNATVSRFIRRLGYDSYEEARRHAREERGQGSPLFLAAARPSPRPASSQPMSAEPREPRGDLQPRVRRALTEVARRSRRAQGAPRRLPQQLLPGELPALAADPGAGVHQRHPGRGRDRRRVPGRDREPRLPRGVCASPPGAADPAHRRARGRRSARSCSTSRTRRSRPGQPGVTWHVRCDTQAPGPLDNHVAVLGLCHLIAARVLELAGSAGRRRLTAIESRARCARGTLSTGSARRRGPADKRQTSGPETVHNRNSSRGGDPCLLRQVPRLCSWRVAVRRPRRGLPEGHLAIDPVPDGPLDPGLDRSRQHRLRQAADAQRSEVQRDRLRPGRRHLLPRLLLLRGAEQPAAGEDRRAQDHRAHHDPAGASAASR